MLNSISSFFFGSAADEPTTEMSTETTTTATTSVPLQGAHCRLKETPTEEEWILIDKSRGNSPQRMEQSPLENLLIEHPSMSVYGPRLRQNSAGIDSDISESSEAGELSSHLPAGRRAGARTAASVRSSPRQPRAVAARAGLSSSQQTVKAAQVATRRNNKRQFSGNQLARDNLTAHRVAKRQRNKVHMVQPVPRSAAKRC